MKNVGSIVQLVTFPLFRIRQDLFGLRFSFSEGNGLLLGPMIMQVAKSDHGHACKAD